jgi:hypothetical protein
MVCAERAIRSEIILGIPDGTPSRRGQVEAHFCSFADSVNLGTR